MIAADEVPFLRFRANLLAVATVRKPFFLWWRDITGK